MARMADARTLYASDKVTTTPERLITMLYDRLVRDLLAAEDAIERDERAAANDEITHAQAILFELLEALRLDAWSGAVGLAQLYTWLVIELMQAVTAEDADRIRACRRIVEPLAEAWHQAAAEVTNQHITQPSARVPRQAGAAV